MGAAASASLPDSTRLDEAQCRELVGDSFDQKRFSDAAAAADGRISLGDLRQEQARDGADSLLWLIATREGGWSSDINDDMVRHTKQFDTALDRCLQHPRCFSEYQVQALGMHLWCVIDIHETEHKWNSEALVQLRTRQNEEATAEAHREYVARVPAALAGRANGWSEEQQQQVEQMAGRLKAHTEALVRRIAKLREISGHVAASQTRIAEEEARREAQEWEEAAATSIQGVQRQKAAKAKVEAKRAELAAAKAVAAELAAGRQDLAAGVQADVGPVVGESAAGGRERPPRERWGGGDGGARGRDLDVAR